MLKSHHKTSAITIITVVFLAFGAILQAQPAHKAKERVDQMKKIKLLEILELDDATTDKFLAKYSTYEKKIDEKRRELDELSDEIKLELRKNSSDKLKELTKKFLQLQNEMFDLIQAKINDMKSILSEKEYAKFLIFENDFPKELQKILFKKGKGMRDGKRGDREGGPDQGFMDMQPPLDGPPEE
jgi:transposase